MDGCGGFFFGVNGCWGGVGGREITWYRVLGWMEYFLERGRDGVLVVVLDGT